VYPVELRILGAVVTSPGPRKPPRHLRAAGRRWWLEVHANFELEGHDEPVVTLAGEALDRAVAAREAIDKHGATYLDRFGAPRARPEVAIERDSRLAFARLLRELALNVAAPDSRPPGIGG
jgi:hypothetical protein